MNAITTLAEITNVRKSYDLNTHEVEIKHNEMNQNLRYANEIQKAIMYKEKTIRKTFNDFFVLSCPKDIVSGDFYYYHRSNNKIVIAVGDCTGHGVSGALVSIVGYTQLNQIVAGNRVTDPCMILKLLHKRTNKILQQNIGSNSHNGMDIGLCTYDLTTRKLTFAGAKRPLYIIREGELIEIPGNNIPIGGNQMSREISYKAEEIRIKKGDTLYLNSDGFADQFGGPYSKKLKTKYFKEMLLETRSEKMKEQKNLLKTMLLMWKGDLEQTDDILVMGFKF